MEHEYYYLGGCPNKCGSKDVVARAYCGSNAVYIHCLQCNVTVTSVWEAEKDKLSYGQTPKFLKG